MRLLTLLLLISVQALVIFGHGGYGDEFLRCKKNLSGLLTKDALERLNDLVTRFGNAAYQAYLIGYREIFYNLKTMSPSAVENYLCNKIKNAVRNPSALSYEKRRRSERCSGIGVHYAQILNYDEQNLAKIAAGGTEVIIGLVYRYNSAFKWLGFNTMVFNNWASGEPNKNRLYDTYCVIMGSDGRWKMDSCSSTPYALCETRPITCDAVPEIMTTARPPTHPRTEPMPTLPEAAAKPSTGIASSGDVSALKDSAAETKSLELSMDIAYDSVRNNPGMFSAAFFEAVRRTVNPRLITVKQLRSGSTIVSFTLTAPKDSGELQAMIHQLKRSYDKGDFKMVFNGQEIAPTAGFKLKSFDINGNEEPEPTPTHDGLSFVYRVLIYIFVIIGILIALTLIVLMAKSLYRREAAKATPSGSMSPPIFWVNGIPSTSEAQLGPPPEKDAPPAYSETCEQPEPAAKA